jgi:hypothetical protein
MVANYNRNPIFLLFREPSHSGHVYTIDTWKGKSTEVTRLLTGLFQPFGITLYSVGVAQAGGILADLGMFHLGFPTIVFPLSSTAAPTFEVPGGR